MTTGAIEIQNPPGDGGLGKGEQTTMFLDNLSIPFFSGLYNCFRAVNVVKCCNFKKVQGEE